MYIHLCIYACTEHKSKQTLALRRDDEKKNAQETELLRVWC